MRLPTTSAPWAMQDYPQARQRELNGLLDLVELKKGMVVVDVQAAGGYVSDAIHARLDGAVRCVCIEPSDALRARISPRHTVLAEPVHAFPSVPAQSADLVVGLAGLHHSDDMRATVKECYRVLKPGGHFVLCDVEIGSAEARWLDEFVNEHSSAGHQGSFITVDLLDGLLGDAGFGGANVSRKSVPWAFASEDDAVRFFLGLFGLQCDLSTLRAGMYDYFNISADALGCSVDWNLLYARGTRPLN